ncbi:MAG: DegV family protein [Anaerolineaceae bacterium]|nr:DegV family protein [Anaerolineaceae bacterium]
MSPICIVTDSSAQFAQPSFPGRNIVKIISHDVEINGRLYREGEDLRAQNLPSSASKELQPKLIPPSPEMFYQEFSSIGQSFDTIIGIFLSSSLSECFNNATKAAATLHGRFNVQTIDSQTTSLGLGLLVQAAADLVSKGCSLTEVELQIRSQIPQIYGIFCMPGLTYLNSNKFIDHAQATIGEMLGLLPIFALEEGQLSPLEKVRNHRHAIEFFQEFLDEFEYLQHIALLQSAPPNPQEARMLRDYAQDSFPKTPFTEHTINLPLSVLFGPRSMGLIVVEAHGHPRH